MTMWKFKSCPHCGGDIFIDRDMDGWYEQCLQCSHRWNLKNLDEFKKQTIPKAETKTKEHLED